MARILIVDDDATLLLALEDVLLSQGHEVVTASDGHQAAKLFQAEPFELLLTDLVMPNREGIETIIELRRDFPGMVVIAMSGGTDNSKMYLKCAERLGAYRTLAKPFTTETLNQAIADAMNLAGKPQKGA